MVVQPSPWLPGTCVTQDMPVSEGLWLNQSLPFNITSSNTIFLFNCSPRLMISPLNCTSSSLCHRYLENSGHVDKKRALQCASGLDPCCTFLAGGTPSAYKIRLHSSGCRGFRSILHLNQGTPPNEWEEGLEIQWTPPPEPLCKNQLDCSGDSKCSPTGQNGTPFRCLCNRGHYWNHTLNTCSKKKIPKCSLTIKISIGVVSFFVVGGIMGAIMVRKSVKYSNRAKLAKAREDMLKSSNGGKPSRLFSLKEVKKATNGFAGDRILGSGGFGEVYKGELQDGTIVAVKSAKVGDIKSTQQVLNEVGILSQVNHKNLVRLMGCCVESQQPLMIYEYISNGTLYDHLHHKRTVFLAWKTRAIDFSRNEDDVNLVVYVSQRANGGSIMEVVDRDLFGEETPAKVITSMKTFCELALTCLREKKGDRPSMKDVVQELQGIMETLEKEASDEVTSAIV
ncbi:hypothetical protein Vadar_026576 [Vaccinium darrowii]|uniref:Uncharacterized protein n=1 Tax=Vaccinium darrowii TaxID=229202 RepID=A0ACB7XUZ1_9ERIC|nr:hypothetical protein Vadar_026576 [Vaccinium darrowii]